MNFEETDIARYVGCRPAKNGVQVVKQNSTTDTIVIVHTITAGKTLHLVGWNIFYRAMAVGHLGDFYVRNDSDVLEYYISRLYPAAVGNILDRNTYYPPLEIPAGYDICIVSSNVNSTIFATIFGWEE